jgi:hypothetical protein
MTDTITIPPEALEAAAVDLYYDAHGNSITWEDAPAWVRDDFRRKARAACLAMLREWPGMEYMMGDEAFDFHHLILPLNTEPRTSQIDVAELDKTRWD